MKICPKCTSTDVKEISWGLPPDEKEGFEKFLENLNKENLYWKGDIVVCSCKWHCVKCHYEWSKDDDGHYDIPEDE